MLFPYDVHSKEYVSIWGESATYKTKNEAIEALLLQSVVESALTLSNVLIEENKYTLYKSYFAHSFLQYIEYYAEQSSTQGNPEDTLHTVVVDITVNEQEVHATLTRLGLFISNANPLEYKLVIDSNLPLGEQKNIEKTIHVVNEITGMYLSENAKAEIRVWKNVDSTYSGLFSYDTIHYTYKSSSLSTIMEELCNIYFTSLNSPIENQPLLIYNVEVYSLPTTQDIFDLDAIFTQKLTKTVEDVTLSNITSSEETMKAVWICAVYEEMEFLESIQTIFSHYPGLSYKIIAD